MTQSIISNKGMMAIESAKAEKPKFQSALKYLKVGQAYKVRVPSLEEVAEIYTHSVFGVFNTCACTKDDYYDKAVEALYVLANKEADETKKKDLKEKAYALKAKPRYFFGFINLEDGLPMVIDLSKKQAQGIHNVIMKNEKRIGSMPFEISKADGGSVTLNMMFEDDLTTEEAAHFKASEGKEIPLEAYEGSVWKRQPEEQLLDLKKFGFDTSLIVSKQGGTPTGGGVEGEQEYGF